MTLHHRSATYQIEVENPASTGRGIAAAHLDDTAIETRPVCIALADDGMAHRLWVRLGQQGRRATKCGMVRLHNYRDGILFGRLRGAG